ERAGDAPDFHAAILAAVPRDPGLRFRPLGKGVAGREAVHDQHVVPGDAAVADVVARRGGGAAGALPLAFFGGHEFALLLALLELPFLALHLGLLPAHAVRGRLFPGLRPRPAGRVAQVHRRALACRRLFAVVRAPLLVD